MIPTMRRRIPQIRALLKASLLKSATEARPSETTLPLPNQLVALLKGTASAVLKSIPPAFGALAPEVIQEEAPYAG
jgi:hypothetical protein